MIGVGLKTGAVTHLESCDRALLPAAASSDIIVGQMERMYVGRQPFHSADEQPGPLHVLRV